MTAKYAILGLGKTGYSCVKYLADLNEAFIVLDDRDNPPYLKALREHYPGVTVFCGNLDVQLLDAVEQVIISPGLPFSHPLIAYAKTKNKPLLNDITLFLSVAKAPIVAVTGSNGKSTVVKLIEHLTSEVFSVLAGGNLGTPVLDLLTAKTPDYYLLELSSFQLMLIDQLNAFAAVVLNISPDHLDWHRSYEEYKQAKMRIYEGCQHPVYMQALSYVLDVSGETILQHGRQVLKTESLPFLGKAYYENALVAFEVAHLMGLSNPDLAKRVHSFKGLPHRFELVADQDAVRWYNDSKATNMGACIAAVEAVRTSAAGRLVLMLSGLTKGVALTPLKLAISDKIDYLILVGEAAWHYTALFPSLKTVKVAGLRAAVHAANQFAEPGDVVLFSPAGASFDLFKDYQDRGNAFRQSVKEQLCLNTKSTTNT